MGLYGFTDWFSKFTGYALGEDEKIKLAECLTNKNSVFYVSETCPKCDEHLELFGDGSKSINVFLCEDAKTCPAEGGVPAWRINGEFHYGQKNLKELIDISRCDVRS